MNIWCLSLPSATVKNQWWDKNRLLIVKLKIVALEKTSIEDSLEFLFGQTSLLV